MKGLSMTKRISGSHFSKLCSSLTDPRISRRRLHSLESIVTITVCAVLCGVETWKDIAEFGVIKKSFFSEFLDLSNGIPSHDTFARVFSRIDPVEFEESFYEWQKHLHDSLCGDVVAIDGKTLRGARDKSSNKSAIHMVSAWSTRNKVVLSQTRVSEKSNEITAVPKLLKILDLEGCVVTMDAMGCQKDHAEIIKAKKADYVLALKGNQSGFHEEAIDYCKDAVTENLEKVAQDYFKEKQEYDHGRLEERKYYLIKDLSWSRKAVDWKGIESIGIVKAKRIENGVETNETRFYCSSLTDVKKFARAVRSHWGIENCLHWVLDVSFNEDKCRIRKDNAAENLAVIRHIALNLLNKENSAKRSIKTKMKCCGWSNEYLIKVLLEL